MLDWRRVAVAVSAAAETEPAIHVATASDIQSNIGNEAKPAGGEHFEVFVRHMTPILKVEFKLWQPIYPDINHRISGRSERFCSKGMRVSVSFLSTFGAFSAIDSSASGLNEIFSERGPTARDLT